MGNIKELIQDQERDARIITEYTREMCGLGELCFAFPSLEEKDLLRWFEEFAQRGDARVLEFGGGVKQIAALATLWLVDGIEKYVGYEIKELSSSAKEQLADFPQYQNVQGGLSDFNNALVDGGNFDVAFAHSVAEHLPHPFLLVRKLHGGLKEGGVLFINGIYIHRNVADDLFNQWKDRGYKFKTSFGLVDQDEERSGIARVNIALKKTSDVLLIPIPTSQLLTDYDGNARVTLVYESPIKPG